jgi:pimeloyl-ACP methyl ester carboxylesterase
VSDPSLAPAWLAAIVGADTLNGVVKWVQAQPWWTVLPGLLAGLQADRLAALAEFAKAYLTDERQGDAQAGVRARAKQRLERLLAQIYSRSEPYDDVFVVGHSMGAAIAIDALADWGADRARTHLHVWGGPMRVFGAQEPELGAECDKLLTADPPLAGWIEAVARNDWVAGFTPGHRDRFGEASSKVVRSPQGWLAGWNASTHEQYFRNAETLVPLIAPVPATASSHGAA